MDSPLVLLVFSRLLSPRGCVATTCLQDYPESLMKTHAFWVVLVVYLNCFPLIFLATQPSN